MTDEWTRPITVEEMYGDWAPLEFEDAEALTDESLDPRPSISILDDVAATGISAGDLVLDIGGRDGFHALAMAERFGCRVIVIDPSEANIEDGITDAADHEFGHLVDLQLGTIEDIPADDGAFDLIFSRDMIGHVEDIDVALAECRRVLDPDGAMVIHQVVATDLMEPNEARRLYADVAIVPDRMSSSGFEEAADRVGLIIESVDIVGSEYMEALLENRNDARHLLRVARMRRAKDRYLEQMGEIRYRVVYANTLYTIYRLMGKLEERVYTLRPRPA
ncbi:MAG: methyltransferase domain-containing protein [Acidimicrobiia bacterium]|nr:methyltransferase domain-containing protein [Acidimicrobiia bacterium]